MMIKETLLLHRKKLLVVGLVLIIAEQVIGFMEMLELGDLSKVLVIGLSVGMIVLVLLQLPEPEQPPDTPPDIFPPPENVEGGNTSKEISEVQHQPYEEGQPQFPPQDSFEKLRKWRRG